MYVPEQRPWLEQCILLHEGCRAVHACYVKDPVDCGTSVQGGALCEWGSGSDHDIVYVHDVLWYVGGSAGWKFCMKLH